MYMKNNIDMIQQHRPSFFRTIKREDELDDYKFNMWKLELKKDLPVFWESMTKKHGR